MVIRNKDLNASFGNMFCKASVFSIVFLSYSLPSFCDQGHNNEIEAVSEEYKDTTAFIAQISNKSTRPLSQNEKTQQASSNTMSPIELDSRLQIGGNYTRVHLKPRNHNSFNGNLGGMQAEYEYRPKNFFYGGGKFTWKEGKTHGPVGHRSLLYFDVQERLGYTFASQQKDTRLSLFSGFGYRHVRHKFNPTIGSPLDFYYNEFYIPVGFLTNYEMNKWFAIGADLTWMPQVFPTVTIVPLKGARWATKFKLANFYAEIPLTFSLTADKKFQLILNPFYERWQDGHTTAELPDGTPLGLPGNTYDFYGAELNFAFNF